MHCFFSLTPHFSPEMSCLSGFKGEGKCEGKFLPSHHYSSGRKHPACLFDRAFKVTFHFFQCEIESVVVAGLLNYKFACEVIVRRTFQLSIYFRMATILVITAKPRYGIRSFYPFFIYTVPFCYVVLKLYISIIRRVECEIFRVAALACSAAGKMLL